MAEWYTCDKKPANAQWILCRLNKNEKLCRVLRVSRGFDIRNTPYKEWAYLHDVVKEDTEPSVVQKLETRKEQIREYRKRYYREYRKKESFREYNKQYSRKYYETHKEECLAHQRDWKQRNRQRYLAYQKDWQQRNRQRVLAYQAAYRKRKREAQGA